MTLAVAFAACKEKSEEQQGMQKGEAPTVESLGTQGQEPPEPTIEEPPAPTPTDPLPELFPAATSFLTKDSPEPYQVPSNAIFFVALNSASHVAELLGWNKVMEKRRDWAAMIALASSAKFGVNLGDFGEYGKFGVDPAGPVAASLHFNKGFVFVLSFSLTNSELFAKFLKDIAMRSGFAFDERKEGAFQIFSAEHDQGSFLVGEKRALFVFVEAERDQRRGCVDALTTLPREKSLGSSEPFWSGVEALGFGANAVGYFSGSLAGTAVKESQEAQWRRMEDNSAPEDTRWVNRAKERFQREMELYDQTLGKLELFAGASLDASGLRFRAHAKLPQESLLWGLLANGTGIPELFRALEEKPYAASYWKLNKERFKNLTEQLLTFEEGSWDSLLAGYSGEAGVDFAALWLAVAGEAAVTIWGSPDFTLPDADEMIAPLRGAVAIPLSDPEKVRTILTQRLASLPSEAGVEWDDLEKLWTLKISGHPFHLKIVGSNLLLSTDRKLTLEGLPAVIKAGPEGRTPADVTRFMSIADSAGSWVLELGSLVSLALANVFGYENGPLSHEWIDSRLGGPEPKLKESEAGRKAEFDANMAELNKKRGWISSETERLAREVHSAMTALVGQLGYLALSVRANPDGYELFAGYVPPPQGIPEAFSRAVIEGVVAVERFESGMERVWREWDAMYELLDKLEPLVVKPKPELPVGAYEAPVKN